MKSIKTLIRLRGIRERQARSDLAAANQASRLAEDELAARRRRYQEDAQKATESASDGEELHAKALAGHRSLEQVAEAASDLARTERRLRAAQGSWRRASQELDSVEELDARRRRELAYVVRRTSERAMDEMMALRAKRRT